MFNGNANVSLKFLIVLPKQKAKLNPYKNQIYIANFISLNLFKHPICFYSIIKILKIFTAIFTFLHIHEISFCTW